MKIENLDLQSQIDQLELDIDSQGQQLAERVGKNTGDIEECNTKINNLTSNMKYFAALSLYSSESNVSSYKLSNSLVNDLSMYHFFVVGWVVYNGSSKTTRRGATVVQAIDNDTFFIHAEWLASTSEIWEAGAQFHISFSNKIVYRDLEFNGTGSGTPTLRVTLTNVWGFCDADLIAS